MLLSSTSPEEHTLYSAIVEELGVEVRSSSQGFPPTVHMSSLGD